MDRKIPRASLMDSRKSRNRVREHRRGIVPLDNFAECQRLAGVKELHKREIKLRELKVRIGAMLVLNLHQNPRGVRRREYPVKLAILPVWKQAGLVTEPLPGSVIAPVEREELFINVSLILQALVDPRIAGILSRVKGRTSYRANPLYLPQGRKLPPIALL